MFDSFPLPLNACPPSSVAAIATDLLFDLNGEIGNQKVETYATAIFSP
jgi:hypothetical protein